MIGFLPAVFGCCCFVRKEMHQKADCCWFVFGQGRGLLLVRDRPWSRHEIALLAEWIAIFAHAYASVSDARWVHRFFRTSAKTDKSHSSATAWWSSIAWVLRTRWLLGGVALAAIGSLPVSL